MFNASNDQFIHAAISAGLVSADPLTGHVTVNGRSEVGLPDGYLAVNLSSKMLRAHRVMWLYHYPQTPSTLQVNHRNGRRWDNRLENLELVTQTGNMRHAVGREYEAINDLDDADDVMSTEWLAEVMALAARGDVRPEEIAALKVNPTRSDSDAQVYSVRPLSRMVLSK